MKISKLLSILYFLSAIGFLCYSIILYRQHSNEYQIKTPALKNIKGQQNLSQQSTLSHGTDGIATPWGEILVLPQRLFFEHPKLKAAYLHAYESKIFMANMSYFQKKILPEDKIQKIVAAIVERESIWADLQAMAMEKSISTTALEIVKLDDQAKKQLNLRLLDILGKTDFNEFQIFQKENGFRKSISDFAGALTIQGCPLSEEQHRLVQELFFYGKLHSNERSEKQSEEIKFITENLRTALNDKQFDYFMIYSSRRYANTE